ncbi:MAG: hypothetical protein NZ770_03835, partial [Candidatus Poseidoniaceae archaeon]|nr:hypothetical protein [Candidatus Poseidoniaceae archaeon]
MTQPELIEATRGEDGIWRDAGGEALHVSASDLERHAYCPLSWHLSRIGVEGTGDAVFKGVESHAKIHGQMARYEKARVTVIRELTVWGWWFGIIVALLIDAAAWYLIAGQMAPDELARYLALLAVVWLGVMLISTIVPWRKWLNWPTAAEAEFSKGGIEYSELS